MLYEEVELAELDGLVTSPRWWIQQKLDGIRVMLTVRWVPETSRVEPLARDGEPLKSTTALPHALREAEAVAAGLDRIGPSCDGALFDGEVVEGRYVAFDLARGFGVDGETPMWRRLALLESVAGELGMETIRTARTAPAKRDLVEAVRFAGAEGVVAKDVDAVYVEGRTRSVLKAKFVRTCDAVVTARNTNGRENATLAMWAGDELVEVGQCSMIGKPDARPGDVVEVRYLYATDDLRLYQPRLVRVREDKASGECRMGQLTPTWRGLVELP